MEIFVSSIDHVHNTILSKGITHVLTLLTLDQRENIRIPSSFDKKNWLFLEMEDTADYFHYDAPKKDQVDHLLNWGRRLPSDAKLLVHCFGGISRSTAAALALKIQCIGIGSINESVNWLLNHRPIARPNIIITKYADELLNANGKLISIVNNIHQN